jgi:hypothetical protein
MELHGRAAVDARRRRRRAPRRCDGRDDDGDGSDCGGDDRQPLEPSAPTAAGIGDTAAFGTVEAQDLMMSRPM